MPKGLYEDLCHVIRKAAWQPYIIVKRGQSSGGIEGVREFEADLSALLCTEANLFALVFCNLYKVFWEIN